MKVQKPGKGKVTRESVTEKPNRPTYISKMLQMEGYGPSSLTPRIAPDAVADLLREEHKKREAAKSKEENKTKRLEQLNKTHVQIWADKAMSAITSRSR